MKHFKAESSISRTQRTVSAALLGGLVLIAGLILVIQSRYDPDRWQAPATVAQPGAASNLAPETTHANADMETAEGLLREIPTQRPWDRVAGLMPLGAAERYDAVTLSDKINGKAELYLSAGFQELESQRFAFTDKAGLWLERYVYAMESYSGAFSVFSQQRRPNSTAVAITGDAYRSANGVFLVHGPYYLELIASDTADALWPPMAALAAAFVDNHAVLQSNMDQSALFPVDGLVTDSFALATANAFGFSRLDQVYSARYEWEGTTATAFVSHRESPVEAATLADAYVDFLVEYDAQVLTDPPMNDQMYLLDVFGTFEIVFHQGNYLAGVHEADNLERGMALARQLKDNLKGATR